ncbi:C-8 sterol isomerase [Paraphoma chrysanthemicola]|uniref:C-8 sterol isomerase n=1 Tax=Paraphoma chrysanthemicola TaxID=798071 RepID=A0A8K0VZJ7_9PLEO|nr:C-8 sterol isomerase [Paraphoma chrysanthemicola]
MQLLTLLSIPIIFVSSAFYFIISRPSNVYIFDPTVLHSLTHSALQVHGNNTAAVVSQLVSELSATHPKHVNLDEEWVFNNAGGAMGAMYIIHASLTEYLIIFGTALGTEGHTGRHTADDYFYILQGEELAYAPGVYEPERYPQGSVHHLKRGQVKQYKMDSGCFALEYARGWIPGMLFFGFADTFTSTLDFYTLWRTVWITGREMIGNLMIGKL